jgi:hypothetical protein
MNIKKSQLLEIIKAVVRETIKERKAKFAMRVLSESHMQEDAPPGFAPDGKFAKAYNKIKATYPQDDQAAYATMWKLHKKMNEAGLTSEAAYKVVSPSAVDTSKVNKARAIQTEPDVNEAAYKVVAPRQARVQQDDHARTIQTDPKVTEAAYKVAAPRQARVQKDNHALKIQTDPKVTENHKVQARSALTVKDLPQDPKNVRDPEVPQS